CRRSGPRACSTGPRPGDCGRRSPRPTSCRGRSRGSWASRAPPPRARSWSWCRTRRRRSWRRAGSRRVWSSSRPAWSAQRSPRPTPSSSSPPRIGRRCRARTGSRATRSTPAASGWTPRSSGRRRRRSERRRRPRAASRWRTSSRWPRSPSSPPCSPAFATPRSGRVAAPRRGVRRRPASDGRPWRVRARRSSRRCGGEVSELLTPGARRARAALVFLAALAYFLLFHRYGFFIQDEGVIAYQALRVSHGQLPYADFQTAYTPASFYLNAVLFRLFGPSLALLRAAGSVTCAATAALLFLSATRVLPPPYALLPSLLYVVLEDQESHGFVVHTIAYPARYVEALWAMSLWLTLAHARRPRRTLAAALGLLVAAIAAFKHNVGIYNAWGAGLSLILVGQARENEGEPRAPG